jgi:TolB-like protein
MTRLATRQTVPIALLLAALAPARAEAAGEAERVWILPFEQLQEDRPFEYLREALPALLAVAISHTGDDTVVERERLDELLDELSLTLEGLTSRDDRRRIGKLLGATVMISGSYTRQDDRLLLNVQATDLETGVVTAASSVSGHAGAPRELVVDLYRAVSAALGATRREPAPNEIDRTPWANLHFMRGLGLHFSGRYSLALAEFILAADEEDVTDIARLWLARTYMADRRYDHAYLELIWLSRRGSALSSGNEIAARMRECERHLGPGEVERVRQLAEPPPAVVGPFPVTRTLYRCAGDRTAALPVSIEATQLETLVIRADLVQVGAALAAPVIRDVEVPVRIAAPGISRITSSVVVTLPAVTRETAFELRFRSRRHTDTTWRPAGRVAVRVHPADPIGPRHGGPCR